ncbi:hypothetical protein [Massilia sp. CCM 8734]|uniref:hypothetical protein n=1 Tax=Massilia sp. CCM 8734 TaxID=2609283 RepID=UPI001423F26C|nr:hypothetical protein [Massilia sp. CCM 8734]NHZ99477.1 hypothetical protein [Massilia sp. CCM 8734]
MSETPELPSSVAGADKPNSSALKFDLDDLPGNYFLQGVMEVGSELWLGKNGKFQFMLTYGAQDDGNEGVWEIKDDLLVLTPVEEAMVFRLETDNEFTPKQDPEPGQWVAVCCTADIYLKNIEVRFEAASGKGMIVDTNPANGQAIVSMAEGEVWARTGLRRSGTEEAWQWLSMPPERASARIAAFRLTNPISAMTAFISMELKAGAEGLVVADEESALSEGVYKKAR